PKILAHASGSCPIRSRMRPRAALIPLRFCPAGSNADKLSLFVLTRQTSCLTLAPFGRGVRPRHRVGGAAVRERISGLVLGLVGDQAPTGPTAAPAPAPPPEGE